MPKIICVHCSLEMPVVKIGVTVVEMAFSPPSPYCFWSGDLQRCRVCGRGSIGKHALETFHHQEGFWDRLDDTPDDMLHIVWERVAHSKQRMDGIAYLREGFERRKDVGYAD